LCRRDRMNDEKKIFLSYPHKYSDLANEIDNALRIKGIKLTRDKRDLKFSIKEFMKTIRSHDLVLMLIQYFTNWIGKSSSFIPISKYFSVKCLKS